MAKFYIKVTDVELGMELDMEELVTFGEAFSEALTPELINKFEALLTKAKANPVKKEEPEEEPEPEEDQDDEDAKVECTTYASDMTKYKFVKSWLKTGDIKFNEDTTCTGRLRMKYELAGSDIIALANYLEDNEVDKGILI